jgi:hypothetical protein
MRGKIIPEREVSERNVKIEGREARERKTRENNKNRRGRRER